MGIYGTLVTASLCCVSPRFPSPCSHNIDNAQKQTGLSGQSQQWRERRDEISCLGDQAMQGLRIRWILKVEREARSVRFPLPILQALATVAKLTVQFNSLLSPGWHLKAHSWHGSTGSHRATGDGSPNNCKLDLTWFFLVSYCLSLRSSNEADKNKANFSQSPTEMPGSNLLSWKHISVFEWGMLWNFNFLGKFKFRCVSIQNSFFAPQTSEMIMEINFSVGFNANKLNSKPFLNLTNIHSSNCCGQTDDATSISKESEECPCPDEGKSSKLLGKKK